MMDTNHMCHFFLTRWAKKNNVILFVLPPHTSHLLQPLDVGIFGPFKTIYNKECQKYLRENPGAKVTKLQVAKLTRNPYLSAFSPQNLISAFRKPGVHPCQNTITNVQVAPATLYETQTSEDVEDEGNKEIEVNADNLSDVESVSLLINLNNENVTNHQNVLNSDFGDVSIPESEMEVEPQISESIPVKEKIVC